MCHRTWFLALKYFRHSFFIVRLKLNTPLLTQTSWNSLNKPKTKSNDFNHTKLKFPSKKFKLQCSYYIEINLYFSLKSRKNKSSKEHLVSYTVIPHKISIKLHSKSTSTPFNKLWCFLKFCLTCLIYDFINHDIAPKSVPFFSP